MPNAAVMAARPIGGVVVDHQNQDRNAVQAGHALPLPVIGRAEFQWDGEIEGAADALALSTQMRPPISSTSVLEIAEPSPVPP